MPGRASDVRGLNALPLNLPPSSEIYSDSAYTDYITENSLLETSQITLKVIRKKNSQRKEKPWEQYIKQSARHYIETVFGTIRCTLPKSIHGVIYQGFLLKL
ncbi:MAG: hypothetical protein V7K33_09700 [Nostoc sp.]